MKISTSVDINAKAEEVFSWIKDGERAMAWQTNVSKEEILHQTPDMVGTTFRETVEEDGQGTELYGVITDYKPDQMISFHLEGDYNAVDVEYRVEEIENHTRVTANADIRFKGFIQIMSMVFGPTFKRKTTEQLRAEFAKLKELCEHKAAQCGEGTPSGGQGTER
jgi:hypothetical protein